MNSKFIKSFTNHIKREGFLIGECYYYAFSNGNRAKLWCSNTGVNAEILHVKHGKIDSVFFPFSEYFEKVQCSQGAPFWTQHISGEKWQYEGNYNHVLPKQSDYKSIANAIETYFILFEGEEVPIWHDLTQNNGDYPEVYTDVLVMDEREHYFVACCGPDYEWTISNGENTLYLLDNITKWRTL